MAADHARTYRQRYTDWWRRLHASFPRNVAYCIREDYPDSFHAFQTLLPDRPVFVWYAVQGKKWNSFFSEGPCWIGTFHNTPDDFVFTQYADRLTPLISLATREYSWNIQTPGAVPWAKTEGMGHSDPKGEIYQLVLPRIVRNLFGRAIAEDVVLAVTQNIHPDQIFDRFAKEHADLAAFKDSQSMMKQAEMAAAGAAAMDRAWAKVVTSPERLGLDDYALNRLLHLREMFHCCHWMAKARASDQLARERAIQQDQAGAETAIGAGLETVRQAREACAQLLAERTPTSLFTRLKQGPSPTWRRCMADTNEMESAEQRLTQTRQAFKDLGSLGAVPQPILENLARQRIVRATLIAEPITVDGQLDEPAWRGAYPIETFLVVNRAMLVAAATLARESCTMTGTCM